MQAKFTVLQCQQEQYSDDEDYLEYEDTFNLQPRSFSKRKRWQRPCVNEQLSNVTTSRSETQSSKLCSTELSHGALLGNDRNSDLPPNGTSTLQGTIPHLSGISMSSLPETNYEPVSYESFLEDEELSKAITQDEGFGTLPPGGDLESVSGRVHPTLSPEAGQQWLHQATPAPEGVLAGKKVSNISEVQEPVNRTMVQHSGTLENLETEPQKRTAHTAGLWDSIASAASKAPLQENRSSFQQDDLEHNLGLQELPSQGAEDKLLRETDKMSLNLYESKETINTEPALSADLNSSSALDNPASSGETADNRTAHSHTRGSSYSPNELDARLRERPHQVASQGFYESLGGRNASLSDVGPSEPVQEQIPSDVSNSLPEKLGREQEDSELAKGTSLLETTFAHTNELEPSNYVLTEERDELVLEPVLQEATAPEGLPEMDSVASPESSDEKQLPNAFLNSPEQLLRHKGTAPNTRSSNWRPRQARSLQSTGSRHGLGLPSTRQPGSREPLSEGNRAEQDLPTQTPDTAEKKKVPKPCGPHSPFCSTLLKKRSLVSKDTLPEVMVPQKSLEEKSNMVEGRLHLGGDAPQVLFGDSADEMHLTRRPNTDGGVGGSSEGAPQGALGSKAGMATSSSEMLAAAVAADLASNWNQVSLGTAKHAGNLQSPPLPELHAGRAAAWAAPGSKRDQGRQQIEETNSVEQLGQFSPQSQQLRVSATEDHTPESMSRQSLEETTMKPASKENYSLAPSSPAHNHSTPRNPDKYVQASPDGQQMLGEGHVLKETGEREGQSLGEPQKDEGSNSTVVKRNHAPAPRETPAPTNRTHSSPSGLKADKSDYDEYGEPEQTLEDFDIYGEEEQDPRSFQGEVRQYFIAAVEVMWDYGNQRPRHFLKAT